MCCYAARCGSNWCAVTLHACGCNWCAVTQHALTATGVLLRYTLVAAAGVLLCCMLVAATVKATKKMAALHYSLVYWYHCCFNVCLSQHFHIINHMKDEDEFLVVHQFQWIFNILQICFIILHMLLAFMLM